ncbi:hypothetical protein KC360_g6589 [Hortaea werneckii]|nr:hypothetical protein KC325_g6403 [Hortaea werneckii]KAI6991001.1 hypothetical protein KC359_g6373 [Hortaea werneckii]KAI7143176.1 hypothetical protein KC344_g6513 [Hortaea werneckii]KAI7170710.1 hypothetical protein KC360_g6589 [Hortaea werneckii]KAI7507950.1 hypothetical protein KC347_g6511 [Hortaea werneckii]
MHVDKAYCSRTALAVSTPNKDIQGCMNESADSASLESTELPASVKHPTGDLGDDYPSNNNSEDLPVFALSTEDVQAALPELAYWNDLSNPYAECHAKGGIPLVNHLHERHTTKSQTQIEATRAKRMSSLRATSAEQWAAKMDYLTPESLQRLSPYVGAHVDSPCTAGDLIHALKCGHKIMTDCPEVCAANCIGAFVRYANPKGLDRPFNCNVCINEHLNAVHAGKLASTVDVHLVDPWRAWGWKSWLKTGIGFVNSNDRPKLQIACLDLQVRGRHCGAVFDPISFEYTERLLSQTEQLLLATEGQILSESCRDLSYTSGDTASKTKQLHGMEVPYLNMVDEVADKAPRRRPLWTKRVPAIGHRLAKLGVGMYDEQWRSFGEV